MKLKEQLIKYVDAGYPIIFINSFEEIKTDAIIKEVMGGREGLEWNGAKGFVDFRTKQPLIKGKNLVETLRLLDSDNELDRKFLVLKDAIGFLEEQEVTALLKDVALQISQGLDTVIVIVSSIVKIPKELEKFITIVELEYPTQDEIKKQIDRFSEEQDSPISDSLLEEMSISFKGLTEFEIESLLATALAQNGMFTRQDLNLIFEQKQQMIMKSGILEMIPLKERPDDIGGLESLKTWLRRKAKVYKSINKAMDFGVDMPKGVLIAGVPGCGKSLAAKVTAQLFEVPLLRLDMGKIMGKYVGESEENMRKAISLAEAISPCVLWIDELEKAFAGIDGSGSEVTVRLFGTFLTWMQEKTSPAFVIATANDITKLPPELMRKGRFDEIFYVGLPNRKERKKIFEIHIAKRRKSDLSNIDLDMLVSKTEGYSGADIEGVVKDAVENTFADDKTSLSTDYIISSINNTHSLSEIMKESLNKLSKEYETRKFKNASA
ncbi:MAG: AAA family ATPase [Ruminococcus callidus]|uniref:AAA family ATPase n=1 Tax=Ruminococcus callidus TaxID=40519 RepID=UPI002E76AADC|nr:AAA family ATPase [Ruminococcus callidus]MEE0505618.1 AAA family ATPase [Ruminococcus callidus]